VLVGNRADEVGGHALHELAAPQEVIDQQRGPPRINGERIRAASQRDLGSLDSTVLVRNLDMIGQGRKDRDA
jgi:hypothetical protein